MFGGNFLFAFGLFSLSAVFIFDTVRTLIEIGVSLKNRRQPNIIPLTTREIAVVIPAHNCEDRIADTLLSLPMDYTIFCVANNCTDGTVSLLKELQALLSNLHIIDATYPDKNKINAVIIGTVEAQRQGFPYVLILDDDILWPSTDMAIFIRDKDAAVTALTVLPHLGHTLIEAYQSLEYLLVSLSRFAQRHLGNDVTMASGAATIFRTEMLLEALKKHTGKRMGDDFIISYIIHALGGRIDFIQSPIVYTACPSTLKAWWKQRVFRWNRCYMGYCIGWTLRVAFANPFKYPVGYWVRMLSIYRILGLIGVLVRIITTPLLVFLLPVVFLSVKLITYFLTFIRLITCRSLFQTYVAWQTPLLIFAMFTLPFYSLLIWFSRLAAFPVSLYQSLMLHPSLEPVVTCSQNSERYDDFVPSNNVEHYRCATHSVKIIHP